MPFSAQIYDNDGRVFLETLDELSQSAKIPHNIALPKIVVVGQQSSGKSSVLSAISGIPFPTGSGLKTQFAIELVCRRSKSESIKVSIVPDPEVEVTSTKEEACKAFAEKWTKALMDSEDQVAHLFGAARTEMGLAEYTGYSGDRLRIEIQGPSQEHLTLIDSPGLISVKGAEKEKIDKLINRHLHGEQTIVLAVMYGYLDGVNQRLFEVLPSVHERCIGVITAADLIDFDGKAGEAMRKLVNDRGPTSPQHGWHLLRNLSSAENRRGIVRDRVETAFFHSLNQSSGWEGMGHIPTGIAPLKKKLNELLKLAISSSLPEIHRKIGDAIDDVKRRAQALGNEHSSEHEQRQYLTDRARALKDKIRDGLEGRSNPLKPPFDTTSLRDKIRCANKGFADEMHKNGHTWDVSFKKGEKSVDPTEPLRSPYPKPYTTSFNDLVLYFAQCIGRSPGQSLPGTFDPIWVGNFFLQQSQKWHELVISHAHNITQIVETELKTMVGDLVDGHSGHQILTNIVLPNLRKKSELLVEELTAVLEPYQTPYLRTLNGRYERNLLKARRELETVAEFGEEHSGDLLFKTAAYIYCCVWTYYGVAIDVLIDNVESLAIENKLLRGLADIFQPESISKMSAEEIAKLASESTGTKQERKQLDATYRTLTSAQDLLVKRCPNLVLVSSPRRFSHSGQTSPTPPSRPITTPFQSTPSTPERLKPSTPHQPSRSDSVSTASSPGQQFQLPVPSVFLTPSPKSEISSSTNTSPFPNSVLVFSKDSKLKPNNDTNSFGQENCEVIDDLEL